MLDDLPRISVPVYTDRYVGCIEYCENPGDNWYMTCAELRSPNPGDLSKLGSAGFEYRQVHKQLYTATKIVEKRSMYEPLF